ncbi:helix-turn-helix transcriptional regulator [Oligoflexaceae bacterium]|nr:helix-turn-helix transcriptional regulator [Oligoflexaceae bacterium]
MSIGNFVKSERLKRRWTQQQLADKAGVGLNFVYQLEKEKPTVRLDTTNLVLEALGFEIGVKRQFKPWSSVALTG